MRTLRLGLVVLLSAASSALAQEEIPAPPPSSGAPAPVVTQVATPVVAPVAPTDPTLAAAAAAARVEGQELVIPGDLPRRIALPCAPTSNGAWGPRLVLACGARVLTITFRADGPALTDDRTLAHAITGMHMAGAQLWLELDNGQGVSAETLTRPAVATTAPLPPAPTVSTAPPPPSLVALRERAAPPSGRVITVEGEVVVIDIGEDAGLTIGSTVAFGRAEQTEESFATDTQIIGEVDAIRPNQARVRLGFNEEVRVGDLATASGADPTRSMAAPPTSDRAWSVRLVMTGLLPTDDLGVSLGLQGAVRRQLGSYGFGEVVLRPTGFSVSRGNDFGFGGGYAIFGAALRLFEIGAGIGVEASYFDRFGFGSDDGYRPYITFPTRLRIGSEDGVLTQFTTMLTYADESIQFLGMEVQFQFPILTGTWIFFRGSGGRLPTWDCMMGVRHRLRGNGGPGTLMLRAAIGVGGITEFSPADFQIGPVVSAGFETRY